MTRPERFLRALESLLEDKGRGVRARTGVLLGVLSIVAALYLPFAPLYRFVRDDYSLVKTSGEESLGDLLTSGRYVNLPYTTYWRPITKLTVAANYHLAGTAPLSYYLADVALHLLVVTLIYWTVWKVTQRLAASAMAALVFGIHQGAMTAATWLAARQDVLVTLWSLLAIFLFVLFMQSTTPKRAVAWGCLVLLSQVAALASHEFAVVIPALLAGACLLPGCGLGTPARRGKAAALVLSSLALLVLYWALRWVLSLLVPASIFPVLSGPGLVSGLVLMARQTLVYLATLFSPVNMDVWASMIWPLPIVSLSGIVLTLAFLFLLGVAVVLWQRRRFPSIDPPWGTGLVLFGVAWVAVSLLPPVSLIFPTRWNAYMPLVGAALVTAALFVGSLTLTVKYVRSALVVSALLMVFASYMLGHLVQTAWDIRGFTREGAAGAEIVEKVAREVQARRAERPGRRAYVVLRGPAAALPPGLGSGRFFQEALELYLAPSGLRVQVVEKGPCPEDPDAVCVEVAARNAGHPGGQ